MKKASVLIFDGHNALWRASVKYGAPIKHELCSVKYHTDKHMKEIHCACGSPWNKIENICYGDKYFLVYNFFRNLRPLIEKFSPDKCFFVLEGHPQFRHDIYPEYKGNRIIKIGSQKTKEEFDSFHEQKLIVIDLLRYLPITICKAKDFEADDVIGSLCEDMKDENITIISNDSDFIQLLQKGYESINIYNPIKKEFMKAPEYPYIAWKSLNGDTSDNIEKLLTPAKALKTINNPELFRKFLNKNEENKYLFNRNKKLIEFANVNLNNLIFYDNDVSFDLLKDQLNEMRFHSITNETSWNKFVKTFDCLSL